MENDRSLTDSPGKERTSEVATWPSPRSVCANIQRANGHNVLSQRALLFANR